MYYLIIGILLFMLPLASMSFGEQKFFRAESQRETKVTFNDLEITVPANASQQELSVGWGDEIDYRGYKTPRCFKYISRSYRFGPHGVKFNRDKMLHFRLKISPKMVPTGYRPDQIKLFYVDQTNLRLELVPQQYYDPRTGTLEANLEHFSDYVPGVTPDWDGEGIAPYADYVNAGEATVNICGLNVSVNANVYSLAGRGMDFSLRRKFDPGSSTSPMHITDDWIWDLYNYYDGQLQIPQGGQYYLSTGSSPPLYSDHR